MSKELIAEVVSDLSDLARTREEADIIEQGTTEHPFYIVPPPPVPGKTSWSVTPF